MRRHVRAGFSLLEVVIVLAVLGLLVAVVLSAVQRVREAANRARCSHNLRQVGLAAHHHEDHLGYLPTLGYYDDHRGRAWTAWYDQTPIVIEWEPARVQGVPAGAYYQLAGWAYQLLPYLEQERLHAGAGCGGIFKDPVQDVGRADVRLRGVARTLAERPAAYSCPSRGQPRTHHLDPDPFKARHPLFKKVIVSCHACHDRRVPLSGTDPTLAVAQTDYAANGGAGPGDPRGPLTVLHRLNYGRSGDPRVASAHSVRGLNGLDGIKDGLSQTVLVGEKGFNRARRAGAQADDLYGWASSYTSSTVRWCGGPAPAPYRTPVQDFSAPAGVDAGGRFGGPHPGGALFAFADGSVRVVSYTVDGDVFARLCLAADGRPVSEADYR